MPAINDVKLVNDVTYTVVNNANGTQTIAFNWTAPADATVLAVGIFYRLTTGLLQITHLIPAAK
jgi:hypothetical protein